jgi:hypothetical protein
MYEYTAVVRIPETEGWRAVLMRRTTGDIPRAFLAFAALA